MISRRLVRIKALQALYSYQQGGNYDNVLWQHHTPSQQEHYQNTLANLSDSINQSYDFFLFLLDLPFQLSTFLLEKQAIEKAKSEGDSLGGIIACSIENCPIGLGEPVFGKLQAILGLYILNINAVKGISFGEGFHVANLKGSENNDSWVVNNNEIGTLTNHSGGIIGGMATGEPICFEVAFKPTSTIGKTQQTLNAELTPTELSATGRHDPCVLPRAVPIVEAMANLAIMDLFLEMDFNA